jgi:hypothetical protein
LVENAFINNCLGYSYVEQQATPSGRVVPVMKWHPGETKAQSIYMYNHMRTRYQQKVEPVRTVGAGMEALTFSLIAREE